MYRPASFCTKIIARPKNTKNLSPVIIYIGRRKNTLWRKFIETSFLQDSILFKDLPLTPSRTRGRKFLNPVFPPVIIILRYKMGWTSFGHFRTAEWIASWIPHWLSKASEGLNINSGTWNLSRFSRTYWSVAETLEESAFSNRPFGRVQNRISDQTKNAQKMTKVLPKCPYKKLSAVLTNAPVKIGLIYIDLDIEINMSIFWGGKFGLQWGRI